MIEKGANNWNSGLNGACQGGRLEIVNLMIKKGADNCNHYGCKGHSNLQE